MKKKLVGFLFIAVTFVAWARTWGPFHVSSLGGDFVLRTLSDDRMTEFEAANKIAQTYLASVLNTPGKIQKAVADDYVRVVYSDGQIADFKISRWPSSMPLDFEETVPSAKYRRVSENVRYLACVNAGFSAGYYTVNTGHWGSITEVTGENQVTTTASWVDTGPITFARPKPSQGCQNVM